MKVLLNFLSPIPLDGKRRGNRGTFSEKAFSKAAFLILPLHNSSENALLFLPLYPLIVSSSLCLPAAKLGIGVFGKDNAKKNRGDDSESTGADADRGTGVDNPGTKIDADAEADNPSIVASNKAHATSLFALRYAFFLLVSSSKLITTSLQSSLPSSFSNTLRSKPILSYLMTLVKQRALSSRYSIDKMWTSSLNKVSSGMSAVVKLS